MLLASTIAATVVAVSATSNSRRRLQTTALTNNNIHAAVDACLAEDPLYMVCPNTEYGDAADWDMSAVTDVSSLFSVQSDRPGGGAGSAQFVGGSVFADWNMGSVRTTYNSTTSQHTALASVLWPTGVACALVLLVVVFFGCTALADLSGMANWDTSAITIMQNSMFSVYLQRAITDF